MARSTVPAVLVLAAGCSATGPTPTPSPTPQVADRVTISAVSPGPGGRVTVPASIPYNDVGGAVLPPGSGLLSVAVAASSARTAPFAQLNVYLLTGGTTADYCGQNIPDSPTWSSVTPGFTVTHTVTGFQVFRLPCEVTGIRAMLHTRQDGNLGPPASAQTIAEAVVPASFSIVR